MTEDSVSNILGRYTWVPQQLSITIRLGRRLIARFDFPGLILDAPPTRLPSVPCWPDLGSLPADSDVATIEAQPLGQRVPRFSVSGRSLRYLIDFERRHFVDLRGSLTEYLKGFAKKPRGNLVRAVRHFAQYSDGKIDFREYRTPQEITVFAQLATEISQRTPKHVTHGFNNTPDFMADLLSQAQKGLTRGYILFHRERCVSYIFCLNQHENLRYRKIGYDPEYRKWSPGTVAFYCLLERLYTEQAFEYLDFEGHELAFKAHYATHSISCWRVIFCRPKLRLVGAVLCHYLITRLLAISVGLIHRLGLIVAMKRVLLALRERRAPTG